MNWNWNLKKKKNGTFDVTPFLLFESSADSDDPMPIDVHHHHHHHHQYHHQEPPPPPPPQQEQQEQEQEHHHHQQVAMDDDAESCSYNLPFHIHAKTHDTHHQNHGYDDGGHGHGHHHHGYVHDHGYVHHHDDDEEEHIDDANNWGESKMVMPENNGIQEQRYHHEFVDYSTLDDREFWKTCLGS